MGLSRQEVNLRRLLAKCELMLKDKKFKNEVNTIKNGNVHDDDDRKDEEERYVKYVKSAEDMLKDVLDVLE